MLLELSKSYEEKSKVSKDSEHTMRQNKVLASPYIYCLKRTVSIQRAQELLKGIRN